MRPASAAPLSRSPRYPQQRDRRAAAGGAGPAGRRLVPAQRHHPAQAEPLPSANERPAGRKSSYSSSAEEALDRYFLAVQNGRMLSSVPNDIHNRTGDTVSRFQPAMSNQHLSLAPQRFNNLSHVRIAADRLVVRCVYSRRDSHSCAHDLLSRGRVVLDSNFQFNNECVFSPILPLNVCDCDRQVRMWPEASYERT